MHLVPEADDGKDCFKPPGTKLYGLYLQAHVVICLVANYGTVSRGTGPLASRMLVFPAIPLTAIVCLRPHRHNDAAEPLVGTPVPGLSEGGLVA
jgi:hypothetical protein